jgi:hypothetical protein
MNFKLLSEREEWIAERIVEAAHTEHIISNGIKRLIPCGSAVLCGLVTWWLNYYC